ncbi:hypothetical protein C2G38_2155386 [Gigaspora rosea]|uniref:Uncharacterized protein n=1 Tax=Gigaspora rosea TaxID=44941 RepID=A0A397W7A5_9GLOM|nr:hypothetical protein C2G38_2155386 [Gigaspora rosea]
MCWNRNRAIPLWDLKDENLKGKEFTWVDGVGNRDKDHRLSIFFNSIYDAANPFERSEEYLEKLDKRLAFECYLICSNRNSKLTSFKTEMSIFLNSMGTAHEAIDAFANAGVTITSRHMDRKKADIAELHDDLVDGYLNKNINRAMILHKKYMKRMAFTSNEALSYNIPFDTRLEVLSLHSYDDRIKAREEERKMKDSILFDFYEQELKTVGSYVNALERLNSIDTLESYLGSSTNPESIPFISPYGFSKKRMERRQANCSQQIREVL